MFNLVFSDGKDVRLDLWQQEFCSTLYLVIGMMFDLILATGIMFDLVIIDEKYV